jgi:hypothetical protein
MINHIKNIVKELRHKFVNKTTNSNLGEEKIIQKYLNYSNLVGRCCVDIAASDGTTQSNTLFLYKQHWSGLALEYDSGRFAILANHYKSYPSVNLMRVKALPENVVAILEANLIPKNFAFFNLDIDSYDYFVLDQVLSCYRPQLICTEINEKVPTPIEFSVKYSPEHNWCGDHFYGQSISQLYKLCLKYNYKIVELYYNNAFIMPNETKGPSSLTPELAYRVGYIDKADRKSKFPYNSDMEELIGLPKTEAIKFLNNKFARYSGQYICR